MSRLIRYLRGSVRFRLTGAAPEQCLNALAAARLEFWDIEREDALHLSLSVPAREAERLQRLALRCLCTAEVTERSGLRAQFGGLLRRPVLLLGLLAAAAATFVLQEFVWTIEVEGNDRLPAGQIVQALEELGIAPGCGSMIPAVITATGVEPLASAGKPESAMYDEARLLAAGNETEPVSRESCLAIGDRLDTDIEAGNRGGYDSLAVLTGVTNPHELMTAPAHLRPSYIVRDLRGLQETQPSTDASDGNVWTCANATARLEDGSLTVSDATDINALRAACAAAWTYADNGGDIGSVSLPEFSL